MISVIIPAHNAQDTLADCLQALSQQTEASGDPSTTEIIVVDDGSEDATSAIAAAHGVQVIRQERWGAAAARNAGAHQAQGGVILFLDADCEPGPGWLAAMTGPLADGKVVGVSGRVDTRQRELVARFIQLEYDQRYEKLTRHAAIDFITSATGGFRKDIFTEIGGFRAELQGAEDTDLSFRLAEAGHVLHFAPNAIVWHKHPTSLWVYARRKAHYAYWRWRVYLRHKSKAVADSRTPQTQKLQVILLAWATAALLTGIVWKPALWAGMAMALIFLLALVPTCWYMLRKDPVVGVCSPLFLTVGAAAGGVGLGIGLLRRRSRSLARSDRSTGCSQ